MRTAITIGRLLALVAVLTGATAARAQIAVAALDGKQPEAGRSPAAPRPDMVAVIDLSTAAPKVIGTVLAPASMIGPPASVAVAPDSRFAIVTAAQKVGSDGKLVPDDRVSVIDLADPRRPRVVQTLVAGAGASGVAINRAGTLALVANAGAGTISVFTVARGRLTPVDTLQLDPQLGPADVAISPDGSTALVTQRRGQALWRLSIRGTRVTDTGARYAVGGNPFSLLFSRNGRYAYNTNLLGRLPGKGTSPPGPAEPPAIGTVSVVDLRADRVATVIEVGPVPEHIALSPDGRYLAVTLGNGSALEPGVPGASAFGLLKVYRASGPKLVLIAQARTGRVGQGATWSKDGRSIALQAALAQEIEVHRFDGKRLTRDAGATLKFDARPGAIATALD